MTSIEQLAHASWLSELSPTPVAVVRRARLYQLAVSLTGSVGLGTALTYFVGTALILSPDWVEWAAFFAPRALFLVAIPYVLLLSYLFLRTQQGTWLLRQGAVREAIVLCAGRTQANLLRSRREAAINALCLGQALVRSGRYEEALEHLPRAARGAGWRMRLGMVRWAMEAALRLERWEVVRELFEEVRETALKSKSRAPMLACVAEMAVHTGEQALYELAMMQLLWLDGNCWRGQAARAMAMFGQARDEASRQEVLKLLDLALEPVRAHLPLKEAELLAMQAHVLHDLGQGPEALATLSRAQGLVSDARSKARCHAVAHGLEQEGLVAASPAVGPPVALG